MSAQEEPKLAQPEYPELEATDGGWDPYVTSLLLSGAQNGPSSDEKDDEPVRSLSRVEKRGR